MISTVLKDVSGEDERGAHCLLCSVVNRSGGDFIQVRFLSLLFFTVSKFPVWECLYWYFNHSKRVCG